MAIDSDVPDLRPAQFDNLAISVRWGGPEGPQGKLPVSLYSSENYMGTCTTVRGDNIANLAGTAVGANSVSSVRLNAACPVLASDPVAAAWGAMGRTDVFARASDNSLWHRWVTNGPWSGVEYFAACITGNPAVTAREGNKFDVVVRGCDNALHRKTWNGSAWTDWQAVLAGGSATSDPALVSWGPNRLDVFYRGTNTAL